MKKVKGHEANRFVALVVSGGWLPLLWTGRAPGETVVFQCPRAR
jgi:hypothetical protein